MKMDEQMERRTRTLNKIAPYAFVAAVGLVLLSMVLAGQG